MIKKLLVALVLATSFLGATGCGISPLMGLSAVVDLVIIWKDGNAKKYYTAQQANVYPRVKQILMSLGHTINKDYVNSKGANIIESHSAAHKFSISVSQYDPGVVLVACRIDFMGDKTYTELLYRQLDAQLGVKTTMIIDNGHKRLPPWLRPHP